MTPTPRWVFAPSCRSPHLAETLPQHLADTPSPPQHKMRRPGGTAAASKARQVPARSTTSKASLWDAKPRVRPARRYMLGPRSASPCRGRPSTSESRGRAYGGILGCLWRSARFEQPSRPRVSERSKRAIRECALGTAGRLGVLAGCGPAGRTNNANGEGEEISAFRPPSSLVMLSRSEDHAPSSPETTGFMLVHWCAIMRASAPSEFDRSANPPHLPHNLSGPPQQHIKQPQT